MSEVKGSTFEARVTQYGLLAERVRFFQVLALILATTLLVEAVMVIALWRGYEIRTAYFLADEIGELVPLGPSRGVDRKEEQVGRAFLEDWIFHAFSVTVDGRLQKTFVKRASDLTMGEARDRYRAWVTENNPFQSIEDGETVEVNRADIVAQPTEGTSWVVTFERTLHARGATATEKMTVTAVLDYEGDAKTEKEGRNPYGIWIRKLHWSRSKQETTGFNF